MTATSKTTSRRKTPKAAPAKPPEGPATAGKNVRGPQLDWLRAHAGSTYATDQSSCSIEQLHARPMFSGVNITTLFRWSSEDKWADKRREFIQSWQTRFERRFGDRLMQTRMAEMEQMQRIYKKEMDRLEEGVVQENSWEGVMSVLLRMAQMIDDFREKISSHVPQHVSSEGISTGGVPSNPAIRPRLSEQEAKDAARMIIQSRREALRKSLQEAEASKAAAEKEKAAK